MLIEITETHIFWEIFYDKCGHLDQSDIIDIFIEEFLDKFLRKFNTMDHILAKIKEFIKSWVRDISIIYQ